MFLFDFSFHGTIFVDPLLYVAGVTLVRKRGLGPRGAPTGFRHLRRGRWAHTAGRLCPVFRPEALAGCFDRRLQKQARTVGRAGCRRVSSEL